MNIQKYYIASILSFGANICISGRSHILNLNCYMYFIYFYVLFILCNYNYMIHYFVYFVYILYLHIDKKRLYSHSDLVGSFFPPIFSKNLAPFFFFFCPHPHFWKFCLPLSAASPPPPPLVLIPPPKCKKVLSSRKFQTFAVRCQWGHNCKKEYTLN